MKKNKASGWIDRLGLLAGSGLAIATLLGFLGKFFWVFDLFSHFRVQVFQMALILIGLSVWRRSNRQGVAFLLLAAINYAPVLPFYFGKPPVASEKPVRAVLMNLNALNENTEDVLNFIDQMKPDLLLLEEVTPRWAETLDTRGYPHQLGKIREDCFGILLLSKYPLSNARVHSIGTADVPTLTADIYLPRGEISLIGTHPLPPFNGTYSAHRNAQLAELPELIKSRRFPVLLIGDLNISPGSSHFSRLLKDSGLKNSMDHFGFQPSWPAQIPFMRIPIDHMLHDPAISIHSRAIGPDIGSDHFPVIVDFSVN